MRRKIKTETDYVKYHKMVLKLIDKNEDWACQLFENGDTVRNDLS